MPKNWRQMRLTVTRAVSGFVGRHQPVRQIQPRRAAAAGVELAEEAGDRRLHDLARIVHPVSARQNARLGGRHRLGHHHARDGALQQRRSLLAASPLPPTSACASGAAHWKCAATAAFCASVRLSSATRSARSTASGISLPFLGRRPREFARRKRQPEAADGGAAKFGILPDAHGEHGVGGGLQRLREAQRQIRLGGFVVRVDRPAGLRIAIDRARRQVFRCLVAQIGRARDERNLASAGLHFEFGDHQPVGAARHAQSRAGSRPAPLRAPVRPRARAGLERDGVGLVVGIRPAGDDQAVARRSRSGQRAAFVAGVVHVLVVIDGEHRAVGRFRAEIGRWTRHASSPASYAARICFSHSAAARLQRFHLAPPGAASHPSSVRFNWSSRFCCSGVGSASCAPQASLPRSGTRPVSLMSAKNAFIE